MLLLERKIFSAITLTLLLAGTWILAFNIQSVRASGTIYINADGSVTPSTPQISTVDNITYTFTGNITQSIVVQRNSILVDGAGHTIQGSRSGTGIVLDSVNNVTIRNISINSFSDGIYLNYSSNNTLSGDNAIDNAGHGIYLSHSSNNTLFGNAAIHNVENGIVLYSSSNNRLSGNNATENWNGIVLDSSSGNVLSQNMFDNNSWNNFRVYASTLSDYINWIDPSNLADGRPVYYIVNQEGLVISPAVNPSVGYLALVNCTSITVEDLSLANKNREGLLLAYTSNSTVTQNSLANYDYGIYLYSSSSNIVSDNNLTANENSNEYGVYLYSSSNNTVSDNRLTGNSGGIMIDSSSNNTVSGNIAIGNSGGIAGIVLVYSFSDTVSGNIVTGYLAVGIGLALSSSNTISGNNVTANGWIGIYLDSSPGNTVCGNNAVGNVNGISLHNSSSNMIYHNNFINNTQQNALPGSGLNLWDSGYPSGGNYWSNYTGTDLYSGPYQNETGSDGIGDTQYSIDSNNTDRYPLMKPYRTISLLGDTNLDGTVDISDAILAARAFGSKPGDPNWNSRADINNDGIIDIFDLIILAGNFGKTTV